MTTTVYTSSKTVTANDKDPKHRERLATYRKPRPHDFEASDIPEASEADDLANDQYFYDQLEKNKPPTEINADIEHVYEKRPNPNRDVVFYHGTNGGRRGKPRQKQANIQIANVESTRDGDIFNDYGEMVMPDRDVEMHDTSEKNTKESHVHGPAQYSYDAKMRPKKRRRPSCNNSNPIMHSYGTNSHGLPYNHKLLPNDGAVQQQNLQNQNLKHHKTVVVHQPVRKRKFERIMVTKKLSSPDELHAEIDKIFETKNKHYDKRGHDKSHWELRIVPHHYDEHAEEQTN
ncbi:uncharacterized protein LOC129567565 [Sitodiplosis mosellana]|uniref:uncharacterized protein LOC129567565 n=1 Tax=Sitodiplosis mosellana TaxID=263140 RepID=UPI002443BC6C|nr:uncharacterized protein LOC129567565 [Sitodiplosis mosellana]